MYIDICGCQWHLVACGSALYTLPCSLDWRLLSSYLQWDYNTYVILCKHMQTVSVFTYANAVNIHMPMWSNVFQWFQCLRLQTIAGHVITQRAPAFRFCFCCRNCVHCVRLGPESIFDDGWADGWCASQCRWLWRKFHRLGTLQLDSISKLARFVLICKL